MRQQPPLHHQAQRGEHDDADGDVCAYEQKGARIAIAPVPPLLTIITGAEPSAVTPKVKLQYDATNGCCVIQGSKRNSKSAYRIRYPMSA
jgi:hypothetical protein